MLRTSFLALAAAGSLAIGHMGCRPAAAPEAGEASGSPAAPEAQAGAGSGETAGPPAGASAVPGASGATAAADPAAAAATPSSPEAVAVSLAQLLPANADLLASLDVGAILSAIRSTVSAVPGAVLDDDAVNAVGRYLLELAEVPQDVRVRIVPAQLGVVLLAGWFHSESVVLAVPAGAIVDAPAEGAAVQNLGSSPLQMARRGDHVLLGAGAEFTNAVSRAPGAAGGADAASAWQEGWSALPSHSVVRVLLPTVSALPPDARADLDELGLGQIRRGAFGMALDGTTTLLVDADADEALRRPLAAGYQYAAQALARFRAEVPPTAQGWPAYLDLLLRGLYSHLHIERAGTVTTVQIDPGACDPGLLLPSLIIGFAGAAVEELDPAMAVTWEPIEQPLASSCDAIAGPPGALPVSLASLAPADVPQRALLALFDYGALLRQGLPTAFGLAPFSLRAADVAEVLAPRAAGLSSWDTSEGSGAVFVDLTGTLVGASWGAVLPTAVAGAVPPLPDPSLTREVREGTGLIVGSAAVTARLAPTSSGDWQRAMAAMPPGTTFAYAFSGSLLREAVAGMPIPEVAAMYASTRLMALGVDGLRPRAIVLVVDGDAAAFAGQIEQLLGAASRGLLTAASPALSDLAPLWEAWAAAFRTRAVDESTVLMEFQIPDSLSNADLLVLGAMIAAGSGAWEQYLTLARGSAGPMEAIPEPDVEPTAADGAKPPPVAEPAKP